jgi:prevent-host-death family protein
MMSDGYFDADTPLSELLARVAKGEEVIIAGEGGKPVARLVPLRTPERHDVKKVIADFKAYSARQARTTGDLTFRAMIDEGRRY